MNACARATRTLTTATVVCLLACASESLVEAGIGGDQLIALAVAPRTLSVQQPVPGTSPLPTANIDATITCGLGTDNQVVHLTLSGLPAGVSVPWQPSEMQCSESARLTRSFPLTISSSAPSGGFDIVIRATVGRTVRTETVRLTITPSAPALTFQDGFDPGGQWTERVIATSGSIVSHSVTSPNPSAGGQRGLFREMWHTIDGVGSVEVFHRYEGASYDPSSTGNGPIATIYYSEDRVLIHPQSGGTVTAGFALEQGGKVFTTPLEWITSNTWVQFQRSGLTAAFFTAADGSHPDFTGSGGPIWFGFTRANSHSTAGSYLATQHGIDDWTVVFHPAP